MHSEVPHQVFSLVYINVSILIIKQVFSTLINWNVNGQV